MIVATSLHASFRGSRSSRGEGQEVVTINAMAFQPWIAVGVGVSERYPSRWLWYGYPKLTGEADRAPRPGPVIGAGDWERDMNGPNAGECDSRSFAPSNCSSGEVDPDEDVDVEPEGISVVPSVAGGSCGC